MNVIVRIGNYSVARVALNRTTDRRLAVSIHHTSFWIEGTRAGHNPSTHLLIFLLGQLTGAQTAQNSPVLFTFQHRSSLQIRKPQMFSWFPLILCGQSLTPNAPPAGSKSSSMRWRESTQTVLPLAKYSKY